MNHGGEWLSVVVWWRLFQYGNYLWTHIIDHDAYSVCTLFYSFGVGFPTMVNNFDSMLIPNKNCNIDHGENDCERC